MIKKHKKILNNYPYYKSKHLERLASKMIDKNEQNQKLKNKNINIKFLNNF